jgi:glyoxylase-like metal-dependent hydrolase (beta-lactamase superfamily II)
MYVKGPKTSQQNFAMDAFRANLQTIMANGLEYVPVPFNNDNYAWVITDGTFGIVVDPGAAGPVAAYMHSRKLIVTAVLITHHHGDHVGGVDEAALLRQEGCACVRASS